jgi:hypothetical protein
MAKTNTSSKQAAEPSEREESEKFENTILINYDENQKFKLSCKYHEIEHLGCGNSRISTCCY